MTEVKTPLWRVASCIPATTGHYFLIKDRRTGSVLYFDTCDVFRALGEVHFKREGENGMTRAGKKDVDYMPDVIVDVLEDISAFGRIPVARPAGGAVR